MVAEAKAALASLRIAACSTTDGRGTDFIAAAEALHPNCTTRSTTKAPQKVH